jgi:hypothetical protein
MMILAVGIGGAIALVDGANARTVVTKEREGANALAREVLEHARSVPYSQLTSTGAASALKALPGLGDSTSSTTAWTVERRNQTYTIAVSVCSVDDDQDGLGDHSGGGFCSGGVGAADASPDDYKRLTIDLTWTRGSVVRSVRHAGLINNESASTGPDVEFTGQDPAGDFIESASVHQIEFEVQTDPDATSIKWAVDGVVKETEALSSTTWGFDWQIHAGPDGHIPDGTYVISVTAFDAEGRPGVTRSRTIRLNRDAPAKVENVFGGWNARLDVVDLQWNRNVEPDILGYRVYRRVGAGAWSTVPGCVFDADPEATQCTDTAPPASVNGDSVDYRVVALDEDPFAATLRESPTWDVLVATRSPNQPNPPPSVTAAVQDDDVLLSWPAAPAFTPPYTGSTVIFYRVYRGGTGLGKRIGQTGQQDLLTFLDAGAASSTYQYWVTTVDTNFSESSPVGPVSLP